MKLFRNNLLTNPAGWTRSAVGTPLRYRFFQCAAVLLCLPTLALMLIVLDHFPPDYRPQAVVNAAALSFSQVAVMLQILRALRSCLLALDKQDHPPADGDATGAAESSVGAFVMNPFRNNVLTNPIGCTRSAVGTPLRCRWFQCAAVVLCLPTLVLMLIVLDYFPPDYRPQAVFNAAVLSAGPAGVMLAMIRALRDCLHALDKQLQSPTEGEGAEPGEAG